MAKQKQKSIADIEAQYKRIRKLWSERRNNTNGKRLVKALDIAKRYTSNIEKQQRSQAEIDKMKDAYHNKDQDGYNKALDRGRNRKYSRSTYMGLSKG